MKQIKIVYLIAFILLIWEGPFLYAQSVKDTIGKSVSSFVLNKDNPIVEALDSLAILKCFENCNFSTNTKKLNKYNYAPDYIPVFSDSVYEQRIAKLNSSSPFEYVYNEDVKGFIDLYAIKKKNMTGRLIGLSEYYFPLFEEYLSKYKIPMELKYLAIVESALNPVAKSRAGANGLWQFIYTTGKRYDLKVTSYTDDRFDPIKSTDAACRHFIDLYAIYKDWALVLAAYNSGPGNVNKAIRKSNGETNFWKIKKYLPKETRGYVPAFIAVTYVMNYATEHNIFPVAPDFMSFEVDTVMVKQKLTFDQISEALNIPKEKIEYLNPCYKMGIIPASSEEPYTLSLPQKYIGDFITNETAIYSYKTLAMIEEEKAMTEKEKEIKKKDSLLALQQKKANYSTTNKETTSSTTATKYTVKAGDGLGAIASRNNCTIAQIQKWNNLKNTTIYPGQKLYVKDPTVLATKTDTSNSKSIEKDNTNSTIEKTTTTEKTVNIKYVYHTVQKGDTLWRIANQYKCTSIEEIKKLNNLTNKSTLFVGQKIKVAVNS